MTEPAFGPWDIINAVLIDTVTPTSVVALTDPQAPEKIVTTQLVVGYPEGDNQLAARQQSLATDGKPCLSVTSGPSVSWLAWALASEDAARLRA
jgi:hypothetical protein